MSQDPPASPLPGQAASNNTGPVVQIGGDSIAPINISRRPKLPTFPVPDTDRRAAAEPVWAHTLTPQHAAETLAAQGLAVIAGEHGAGRRISAVRALHTRLLQPSVFPELFDLAADWDDDETPERDTLPDPVPGRGYLIDATSRPLSAQAALALTAWAEELHKAGGCVVIATNQYEWQGDSRFEIQAVRPDALQVARNHLAERLGSTERAEWLKADPNRPAVRGILRGTAAPEPTVGIFADLITRTVSPSDAVAIAERLHAIRPDRLRQAIDLRDRQGAEAQEQGHRELRAIRDEVLLWTGFLEKTLSDTGTRGPDRVMLISAAYLEGASLELCIKAAGEFGPRDGQTARRYREGRSPRRRMRDVGVDVTAEDRAAFESRPGLPISAIRTDWHHWADERDETRAWIERITASDGVAVAWSKQIGERLIELSRTAVDPPFFTVIEKWTAPGAGADTERVRTVAQLLARAAQTDELARDTHKKLLDWSKKTNPRQREAVAQLCSGVYGQRWPHIALVRLRHILAQGDDATAIATHALATHATGSGEGLTRVVDTVESWLEKFPGHPAGPRAFLALVDPSRSANVLARLIELAQASPRVRDFLISGWWATLDQPDVRDWAHRVLLTWAQAVHQEQLDRNFIFGILTDVRNAHTPVDAMSRFLYGSPEEEDPALIEARFALANLRACEHGKCARPDCPLKQPPNAPAGHGAWEGADEPEQGLGEA